MFYEHMSTVLQRYNLDALSTASVLVTVFITVTETWYSHLRKEAAILADQKCWQGGSSYFGLQVEGIQSSMVREATGAWGSILDHIHAQNAGSREHWCSIAFFFSHSSGLQSLEWHQPDLGWVFSAQSMQPKNWGSTNPEVYVHCDSINGYNISPVSLSLSVCLSVSLYVSVCLFLSFSVSLCV